MSHNLMQTGDITHFAGRRPAWHQLGKIDATADTMVGLARLAEMTFTYELTPVFFEVEALDGTYHHQFIGRSVITKNGIEPLAVVNDDFEFNQPMETAESLDRLIEAGGWTPETALALGKGETTVFCLALGEWGIDGDDSRIQDYLLVTDTVDGRHSLQIALVPLRVVCQNTLRVAQRTASVKLSLNHVTGHRVAYDKAIGAVVKAQARVHEALTGLSQIQYDADRLERYVAYVFPEIDATAATPKAQAMVRRVAELRQASTDATMRMVKVEGSALTGYTAFNGVSEAIEHGGIFPNLSTRKSLVLGTGAAAETLQRAFDLVLVA